jgi:hypothetical protein
MNRRSVGECQFLGEANKPLAAKVFVKLQQLIYNKRSCRSRPPANVG